MAGVGDSLERDAGDRLLAQIIEANVKQAAWTTDQLLAGKDRVIESYAKALVTLWEGIAKIPSMQRTMYLQGLMDKTYYTFIEAEKLLDKEES